MLTPKQNSHDMLADGKGAVCSNRGQGLQQKTGLTKGEASLDHWVSLQTNAHICLEVSLYQKGQEN